MSRKKNRIKTAASYLYGKNSVAERVRVNPRSIQRIYLQDSFSAPHLLAEIEKQRIPHETVSEGVLMRMKRADRLQGIIAAVEPFRYTALESLVADKNGSRRTLICLDNINDPHNLGAMMRTAACFGGFAFILPRSHSCEVNDTVMHVASGGENYVPVAQVNNLVAALRSIKESGYWIVGTVVEGGESITKRLLPQPVCLVMGSEGKGLRTGVNRQLDLAVTLPMQGARLSLNVAMTCAIVCFEIAKQVSGGS